MDLKELHSMLTIGETVAVEFKRCGNGIESDTYETVCSFLNRFGGDILMGVLDDGTVLGVPEKAALDMVKNFITVISNPALFSPTVYLVPEIIKDDADVKVTSTSQMAMTHAGGKHPWENMDALVRKVNVDWYDDREIVRTNLIESFDQLMEFARKHLPDKFFLEGEMNVSLRNLCKYSKYYSGEEPIFTEDDVFRIIVPLNDAYSFDFGQISQSNYLNQTDQSKESVQAVKDIGKFFGRRSSNNGFF